MTLFVLPGLTNDDRVPGHYSQNLYGQGASSGTRAWSVVVTGNMTSGGTMTADQDVEQVFSASEVATKVGERSECAQQAREALRSGASVVLAPVAEASGAVAAYLVLNYGSLGTGTGQETLHLGDETVSWVVDVSSKQNTMTAAAAAINAIPTLFCVATVGAAPDYDVTITVASAGIRGNAWLAKLDQSQGPSGSTFTLGRDSDTDAIKTSIATVAAPANYVGVALNGVIGAGTIDPPRCFYVKSTVAAAQYTAGSTVTATGTLAGAVVTDVLTIVGTGGGEHLIGDQYFDAITAIDIEAQAGVGGAFEFGVYSQAEPTASGWVRFAGGTGTDDCANVINLLEAAEYRRIAAAQNDAVNAAKWETHADSESSPLIAHLEQVIFGHNGTSAQAISSSSIDGK